MGSPVDGLLDESELSRWRAEFPELAQRVHLANCSHGAQSRAAAAGVEAYMTSWREQGMDWDGWLTQVDGARADFARLIGARPEDVGVGSSVSQLTAAVAGALDYSTGRSRILTSEAEFPTVPQIWLAHGKFGVKMDTAPISHDPTGAPVVDPQEVTRRIEKDTALVSVPQTYYLNGALADIRSIADAAHRAGALVFVDAYQGLGVAPVDVQAEGIDLLVSGTQKFLLGTPGIAFLYVNPRIADQLRPAATGWMGRANPFAFKNDDTEYAPGARRFDTGTPPILAAYASRPGMQMLAQVGVPRIQAHVQALSRLAYDVAGGYGLDIASPRDVTQKAATVAIRVPDSHAVEMRLKEQGILVAARGPVVRIAPHFYNTTDEVGAAVRAVAEALG
ncbi:MAG: aminotransferase class V-fold PLP-dependent enzyme [Symbiobacteriia bacterium]